MIRLKIVLFASFKELLGCSAFEQTIEEGASIGVLCQLLANKGEAWGNVFSEASDTVKVACNREMADKETVLKEGDEVAFFPPVTGG